MNPFLKRLRLATALQLTAVTLLTPGLVLLPTPGWSNPSGGVVAAGVAEINAETVGHLKVFQGSNRAIINWQDFNIAAGEITEFIQPGADAVALSRVLGGNPSAIYGTLKANGGHILINQNGILVGPGGVVDVGGLNVLSTLDVDDAEFMAGGPMRFVGTSAAGVTNFGTINSAAGDVILMGNFVENHGSIGALNGTVALAAGGEILLEQNGESTISILRGGVGGGTGVNNTGTITGAAVEMKAHGNVYALAVNNSGTIRATGVNRANGRVVLSATGDGTASGKIVNSGTIEANNADGSGGEILIDAGPQGEIEMGGTIKADGVGDTPGGTITAIGNGINVPDGALISASGSEGGTIMIGGPDSASVTVASTATLQANGSSGDAGLIMVQGQDINAFGTFNATSAGGDGGEVNLSGADVTTAASTMINTSGFDRGGVVTIDAGGRLQTEGGQILSNGQMVRGGDITATGAEVSIGAGTTIEATGEAGGRVRIGGGFRGEDETVDNATDTTVEEGVSIDASATGAGRGGQVIIWADEETHFSGSAAANANAGKGGLIEVSGLDTLKIGSNAQLSARSFDGGGSGTILFDPGDVLVGNTSGANSVAADIPNHIINNALQGGTSVLILTESGNITFENTGLDNDRHDAIQWTNSEASFGAFASGNIFIFNHIRTSGAGSINLISGWSGREADFEVGGIFYDDGAAYNYELGANGEYREPAGQKNPLDAEDFWEYYVENGQFGFNGGSVLMGDGGLTRHVVVGSRYGNTNVAGAALIMTTPQISGPDTSESDYVHLGFRDSGSTLTPRDGGGYANASLDLNTPGTHNNTNGVVSPFFTDNDPVVGWVDYDAYDAYVASNGAVNTNFSDINNDGIADGVYAINSSGILDASNPATGGDATLIPFANHFMNERSGNWWWQQIDVGADRDPLLLGGRAPEHGAGYVNASGVVQRADINVVTTGRVTLNGGGRNQNYAQIGHGGNSSAWGDDRGLRDGNLNNNFSGEWARLFSYNGAQANRGATTIARLAPIYGNINVLAGVDRSTVQYDRGDPDVNLTGDVTSKSGFVILQGWENPEDGAQNSAGNINNPNQSADAYVQIGHLGVGQAGPVEGNITVRAGGDINILAGSHTRDHATIGHTMDGYVEWNLPSNNGSQIRFFANTGDHDNPNLRKGELFADPNGGDARGFYPDGQQSNRWDDDFWDTDGDVDNDGLLDTDATINVPIGSVKSPAADGAVHVPGMEGYVVKNVVGDITVESYGNNGITIKGYSNPDTRTRTTDDSRTTGDLDGDGVGAQVDGSGTDDLDDRDGWDFSRDRRFAGIGHGGSSFELNGGHDNERVRIRVRSGVSGSGEIVGDSGNAIGRSQTFLNLIGNIEVHAYNGNIVLSAGNDTFDHAYIGHGGADLADLETSNVIAGDITVTGAGNLLMTGGAVEQAYTGGFNRTMRSYSQIGHHGWEVGIQGYFGDVSVDMGGDITLTGGRYRANAAQIGHQSEQGYGQVGGTYDRSENFIYNPQLNPAGYDLTASVTDTQVTLTVEGDTWVYAIDGNTSNIDVSAGGNILMDHAKPGLEVTQNQIAIDNDGGESDLRWTPTLIGHGGRRTGAFRQQGDNDAYYYKDKTGNITVNAGTANVDPVTGAASISGGNITMFNGEGLEWFTAIGHIFANGDRAGGPDTIAGAYVAIGDITVNALGNLIMNANAAGSTDTVNIPTVVGDPIFDNPVRIGHGGIYDNLDINVLSNGTLINGIAASSDIMINVGNDMYMKGGKGGRNSAAQVGHGYNSNNGGDPSRPTGMQGDISVNVANDLVIEAGHQGIIATPEANVQIPIESAAAVIGHGGHQLDADLTGDIEVYVGNDLTLIASDRTQALHSDDPTIGNYEFDGTDSSQNPLGSVYGLAAIGHWATELDAAGGGPVVGNLTGDVTVVVGNDLSMAGGKASDLSPSPDVPTSATRPTALAYAQIGHSAPGVSGIKSGNITVLVGNDFTTVDGDVPPPPLTQTLNNYVMVGNGDWMRDGPSFFILPRIGGGGLRAGDINVAVGNNAVLDHTLIGHADPAVLSSAATILQGNTFFGVSRNLPFYGGPGSLTATNGTVFTTAGYGAAGELRLYIPQRELNLMDTTTRLNEATATYRGAGGGGVSFASDVNTFDPTRNGGIDAGDPDEIYLQPDLWWDHLFTSTAYGDPEPGPYALDWRRAGYSSLAEYINNELDFSTLPDDASADEYFALVNAELGMDSLPNGQIAEVANPGGLPNLIAFAAGAFGSGTGEYRVANGLSGSGFYTVYYDAVQPVGLAPPLPPVPPIPPVPPVPPPPIVIPPPFDYLPFLFLDKFDAYDRDDLWLFGADDNYLNGIGLIARLLGDVEGEPGVGLAYDSELVESLAELLGFPVDETDEAEEDEAREEDASSYQFMGSLHGIFWQYQPFQGPGHYSSNNLFGTIGL